MAVNSSSRHWAPPKRVWHQPPDTYETFMRSPLGPLFSGLNTLFTVRVGRAGTRRPGKLWTARHRERSRPARMWLGAPGTSSLCRPSLRPALRARPSRRQLRATAPPPWPPGSMAAAVETRRVCETAGCSSEAKLQCPTCLKLGIQGSYFCSQVRLPAAQPLACGGRRIQLPAPAPGRPGPARRARLCPALLGSAPLPAPGRPGAAAPGRGARTKFAWLEQGSRAGGPGGAGAPFRPVAAGDAGPQRH